MAKSTVCAVVALCLVATLSSLTTTAFSPCHLPLKPLNVASMAKGQSSNTATAEKDSSEIKRPALKSESSGKEERRTLRQKLANRLAKLKNLFRRRTKKTEESSAPATADLAVTVEEIKSDLFPIEKPEPIPEPKPEPTIKAKATSSKEGIEVQENDVEVFSDEDDLLEKIKNMGESGITSWAFWDLFISLSAIAIVVLGFPQFAGHSPDLSNPDDLKNVGAAAIAFLTLFRFAVPIRLELAASTQGDDNKE